MPNFLTDQNAHNVSEISMSFLTFASMYLVVYSRKTSTRIKQTSPESIRLKRQELAVKVVSILHGLYTSYGAYMCLNSIATDTGTQNIDMFSKFEEATHYANVAAGFFIADLILCIILVEEHGMEFIIHAIAALAGSTYVSLTGIGHLYFLNLLLFEASTPFLHIRYLLLEYGYGKTIVANINNLLFLLTFAYFRLFKGIPILTKLCYTLIVEKPLNIYAVIFFVASSIAMSSLNIIWFIKILRSAIKAIKSD
jgi:hypothetical protein